MKASHILKEGARKYILRSSLSMLGLAALLLLPLSPLQAASEFTVDWEDEPMFEVENAVPGQTFSKRVTVDNNYDYPLDVYLEVDEYSSSSFDDNFSERLDFAVIDTNNGEYVIGGPGERLDLEDAVNDEDKMYLGRIDDESGDDDNTFEIRITFDKDAGNEYQGRETKFDLQLRLTSEETEPDEDNQEDETGIGGVTGLANVFAAQPGAPGEPTGEEVQGAATQFSNQNNQETRPGIIGGLEDICLSWPLWVWLLLTVVFAVGYNIKCVTKNPFLNRYAIPVQVGLFIGALVIWYFFDECREYVWFPLVVVLLGLASPILLKRYQSPR